MQIDINLVLSILAGATVLGGLIWRSKGKGCLP